MDISRAVIGVKTNEEAKQLLIQAGIAGLQAKAGYVVGVDAEPLTNKRINELVDDYLDPYEGAYEAMLNYTKHKQPDALFLADATETTIREIREIHGFNSTLIYKLKTPSL